MDKYCEERKRIEDLFSNSPFVIDGLKNLEDHASRLWAKLRHIENVASLVEKAAREEGLGEKETLMAFAAGQFHDIACINDIALTGKEYGPQHGARGAFIAFGILSREYDGFSKDEVEIIAQAIKNHDGAIPENLSGLSQTLTLLLRDCDKVDCYRRQSTEPLENVFQRELKFDAPIRKEWAEDCMAGKPMLYSDMKNFNEEALLYLGWFFQLKKKSCQKTAFESFSKLAERLKKVTKNTETVLYIEKMVYKAKELVNLD